MNKFDKEFNKIINQQNLNEEITSEGIKETLSSIWNSITGIGKSISNAINKGITWSINKIKLALEKMWNFVTPNNAQQTLNNVKSLTKIMPTAVSKQANKIIQLSNSQQYKSYIKEEILNKYQSEDNFKKLSIEEQKQFISKISKTYLSKNNIISQEITKQVAPVVAAALIKTILPSLLQLITWCIIGIVGFFAAKKAVNSVIQMGKDQGLIKKTKEDELKEKQKEEAAQFELDKTKEAHQKWKTDQQRQKIFQQVINIKEFQ